MRKTKSNRNSNSERKKMLQKARKELNEFEETVPNCLSNLREKLQEDQSIYCPLDDKFLLRFLRARKFDINKTVNLIRQYYEMRERNYQLFDNLCPESVSHVLAEEIQTVLENRDTFGRNVFIFRAGKWNPDTVSLDDVFRSNYLFLEEMTSSEETQICGVTAIVDFQGLGFYHARQFTPKHAIRMVQIIQNSFPCRFQEFHLVNHPYVFDFLYSVVKPFLSEKIRKRVYFHGRDLTSLHKCVPPKILPQFLGGTCTATFAETVQKFNQKFLKRNQHYIGDNSKSKKTLCAMCGENIFSLKQTVISLIRNHLQKCAVLVSTNQEINIHRHL